ncbi:hypothetical protein [Pseudonocardia acidicola]|uniref:Uncharacterized protein n=1 Tax=Pseudonocardia acidicola TaxID=2724939 RepID=A0ABX1S7R2_9PSEU|nr:hypothetical protein [Pseudonocardia acidicola]NMH96193.1 hypothetical protein [Pseudonocardia acidicola]
MFFIGPWADEATDAHERHVAGGFPDGTYSDIWTDVTDRPAGTFLAYAPACECGRRGADQAATGDGHLRCRRAWVHDHFQTLDPVRRPAALGRRPELERDFLS